MGTRLSGPIVAGIGCPTLRTGTEPITWPLTLIGCRPSLPGVDSEWLHAGRSATSRIAEYRGIVGVGLDWRQRKVYHWLTQ